MDGDDPADQIFRFTGEIYDAETGFTYLRARYYAAPYGRFLTRDTFGGYAFSPQSLNRYSYAGNNPVNRVDPSGHEHDLPQGFYYGIPDFAHPNNDGTYPLIHPLSNEYEVTYIPNAYYDATYGVYVHQYRPDLLDTIGLSGKPNAQAFGTNVIIGRELVRHGSELFWHELAHLFQARFRETPDGQWLPAFGATIAQQKQWAKQEVELNGSSGSRYEQRAAGFATCKVANPNAACGYDIDRR